MNHHIRSVFATEQNRYFHSVPPPSPVSTVDSLNIVLCYRSNEALFTSYLWKGTHLQQAVRPVVGISYFKRSSLSHLRNVSNWNPSHAVGNFAHLVLFIPVKLLLAKYHWFLLNNGESIMLFSLPLWNTPWETEAKSFQEHPEGVRFWQKPFLNLTVTVSICDCFFS